MIFFHDLSEIIFQWDTNIHSKQAPTSYFKNLPIITWYNFVFLQCSCCSFLLFLIFFPPECFSSNTCNLLIYNYESFPSLGRKYVSLCFTELLKSEFSIIKVLFKVQTLTRPIKNLLFLATPKERSIPGRSPSGESKLFQSSADHHTATTVFD